HCARRLGGGRQEAERGGGGLTRPPRCGVVSWGECRAQFAAQRYSPPHDCELIRKDGQRTTISARMVKGLPGKTGAGMMDCKAALTETDGDMEKAIDWLRKKGLSKAAKKAGRVAAEGLVGVTATGKAAAIVEVNSETDFVARNEQFQDMVRKIA